MQIKTLFAENWKSFGTRREIPLAQLTLLIGPNNAGKSNILDVLTTLRAFMSTPNIVSDSLFRESQIRAGADAASIGLSFVDQAGEGTYSLSFSTKKTWKEEFTTPSFQFENTSSAGMKVKKGVQQGATLGTGVSGLSIAGNNALDRSASQLLALVWGYRLWRLQPETLASPALVQRLTMVGPTGENAAALLDHLRERYEPNFNALQRDLRRCAPELDHVVAEASDQQAGFKEIYFHERNGAKIRSRFASEGLKFLLFVLLILHSPERPSIMALEEIEHGLHPHRIADVVGFLRELAGAETGAQILLSSHSPLVLDQFRDTPEAVLVVERDELGMTKATPLPEILRNVKDEGRGTALGDLWYSRVLGGVPKA